MHVWHWWVTGLIAGLIARLILRRSTLGLPTELALGSAGGVACGALMRFAGVTEPETGLAHVLVALVGALGTIAIIHALVRATVGAGRIMGAAIAPLDLQAGLAQLGDAERRVVGKFLQRKPVSHDVEVESRATESFGERAADRIASFGGSWAFIGLFGAFLSAWILFNLEQSKPFDPYPFILLNLILSCVAAAQAPVILMSQNRQAEKDRLHAHADYEVNLKAEMEILALHEKMDELRDKAWHDLLELQQRQLALLEKLERRSAER